MASNAISGVGTIFQRNGVPLAEVTSITGPTMTRDFIDVTSLDSTGGYREFIAGFRDAGTISLSMNYTKTTYTVIKQDFENPDPQAYTIIFDDTGASEFNFSGYVTECPLTIPVDDKITADVTIKITGKVYMEGVDSTGSI
jgi:predicted secreted protein